MLPGPDLTLNPHRDRTERGGIQQKGGTNTERHQPERANEIENEVGDDVSNKEEQTGMSDLQTMKAKSTVEWLPVNTRVGMERMVDYPMSRLGIELWGFLPQSAWLDAQVARIWDTKKRIGEMIGGINGLVQDGKEQGISALAVIIPLQKVIKIAEITIDQEIWRTFNDSRERR